MTLYEKMLLPLILGNDISSKDLTKESGFVDTFTEDPDKPNLCHSFLIMIDDTVRTQESIELAKKLSKSINLRSEYCKIINNIPYRIYDFYIPASVRKMNTGVITPEYNQRTKIISFWGFQEDISRMLIGNFGVMVNINHSIPLEDEMSSVFEKLL